MNRYLFIARVTVKDGERAFLLRNGRYERVLVPGRHALLDPRHELAVELHNVVRAEFAAERIARRQRGRYPPRRRADFTVSRCERGALRRNDRTATEERVRSPSLGYQLIRLKPERGTGFEPATA